jgi:hypothetical protein
MATGKEEFHTINDYLYLGHTGARTPIIGTYSEAEENPKYPIIARSMAFTSLSLVLL